MSGGVGGAEPRGSPLSRSAGDTTRTSGEPEKETLRYKRKAARHSRAPRLCPRICNASGIHSSSCRIRVSWLGCVDINSAARRPPPAARRSPPPFAPKAREPPWGHSKPAPRRRAPCSRLSIRDPVRRAKAPRTEPGRQAPPLPYSASVGPYRPTPSTPSPPPASQAEPASDGPFAQRRAWQLHARSRGP